MPITINGTTGIAGIDGSAGTPALQGSDTNTGIAFGSDVILASTGGTERWRVDSSGRLLVGTSTARANFRVGATNYTGTVQHETETQPFFTVVGGSSGAGGPYLMLGHQRSGAVGGNTVVASGDELGVISFHGSDGTNLISGARIEAVVDGTPGSNDMPGRLVFSTTADGASGPTERMRISSIGNVDIRHANNIAVANLSATATSGFTEYVQGLLLGYAPNNTTARFLYCADTAAIRTEIRSNGGIANFSANNVNLSDRNAKKDITLATGTWDCLKEWEIVNFRYKDQPDDADLNMGVIAQQVAESCPEVITVFQEAKEATENQPAQEERLGVRDQQMMWMAIKALQEAQLRIETLEAKVAALEVTP
jgi:hypothetical protein